jgi:hypothetical protein
MTQFVGPQRSPAWACTLHATEVAGGNDRIALYVVGRTTPVQLGSWISCVLRADSPGARGSVREWRTAARCATHDSFKGAAG